jgi:hypothetical protein
MERFLNKSRSAQSMLTLVRNLDLPTFAPAEKLLFLMTLIYTLLCCIAAYSHGILNRIDFLLYASTAHLTLLTIVQVFILFCCFKVLWWKATIKPRPLFRDWWPMLTRNLYLKDRILKAMPLFISLFILLSLFSNMKGLISYYGTYSWDPFWAETDRKLHFGIDPWRLLQPLLGYPRITQLINILYNFWFPILVFFLYWQLIVQKHPGLRMQFFFTFFFAWSINGTLLAILFASGGPCYFEMMTGNRYFAEQMNYLQEVHRHYGLWSVSTQAMLQDMYKEDKIMIGAGISAMPSMHVATAFLFFLLTRELNKKVGWIFALYSLLIFLGSVHLGWHYAVDGYFSIITTWLYWKLSGMIVKKANSTREVYA